MCRKVGEDFNSDKLVQRDRLFFFYKQKSMTAFETKGPKENEYLEKSRKQ